MILRVPPAAGKGSRVSLSFPDRKKPVEVEVESCDRGVCLATVPVGPILRDNIAREATVGGLLRHGRRNHQHQPASEGPEPGIGGHRVEVQTS
ncbi:hypothetical protein Q1M63_19735 [Sinorhizobium meliloti]|nr:hypothetical protein Q1M63_19735 [Sinorhizobium meliloti]